MDNDNQSKTKIEITQDKLVDILLHAATREDLAKLDTKVDGKSDQLEAKINHLMLTCASKSDLSELSKKVDKLIFLAIATIIVPIALHFFVK